jgi:hypothetical protein
VRADELQLDVMAYDEALAARIGVLLANAPDVTEKKMFGYCSASPRFLACLSQSSGGGGGIRTCDQGLMSSWLWGSPSIVAGRSRPVFGRNKPKIEVNGCRRPGAVGREQREMDVEMDV